jgi:hypothetical protein
LREMYRTMHPVVSPWCISPSNDGRDLSANPDLVRLYCRLRNRSYEVRTFKAAYGEQLSVAWKFTPRAVGVARYLPANWLQSFRLGPFL